jgi:hypothetical protein
MSYPSRCIEGSALIGELAIDLDLDFSKVRAKCLLVDLNS